MNGSQRLRMSADPAQRRNGFYIHLAVFVPVCAGLIAMNTIRQPDKLWSYWVFLGWGAGVGLHAFKVFSCSACSITKYPQRDVMPNEATPETRTEPNSSAGSE